MLGNRNFADDATESLPPLQRLALSYAPAATREIWAAFLALDTRLAATVRQAREPMLGQLRLAWWRDRLGEDPARWPQGEPLLALLAPWRDGASALVPLVDGWEHMLGEAPLAAAALSTMADGRAEALATMAARAGAAAASEAAARLARGWALADLAAHLSHPEEKTAAAQLMAAHDWSTTALPRAMRPLIVLHGVARREANTVHNGGVRALLFAMRLGILGR